MNNYKSQAKHWYRKLMKTPAGYVCLATYRFKQWQLYKHLARQSAMDHLRGEDHAD
ncbi:hypothetical protein JH395_12835 [Lactiplantibacillus plantarum]|uniref:Uncharacterized protein n=1 Tax=Lactiplantibacillus plantarum TaxID=1590 RepID=A0AAX1K7F8_LACPN|nr:hypothetical protein [Lactiplantibacillus plantarum]QQM60599.1 hypothetical protein JH395_12835 [Lactiplantibacillus plantarum]WEZ93700.1 hypothetical protein P3T69_10860 [Lactiplantibacillus plantarum]